MRAISDARLDIWAISLLTMSGRLESWLSNNVEPLINQRHLHGAKVEGSPRPCSIVWPAYIRVQFEGESQCGKD